MHTLGEMLCDHVHPSKPNPGMVSSLFLPSGSLLNYTGVTLGGTSPSWARRTRGLFRTENLKEPGLRWSGGRQAGRTHGQHWEASIEQESSRARGLPCSLWRTFQLPIFRKQQSTRMEWFSPISKFPLIFFLSVLCPGTDLVLSINKNET